MIKRLLQRYNKYDIAIDFTEVNTRSAIYEEIGAVRWIHLTFDAFFLHFLCFFLYSPLTFYESDDIYVACKENILFIFNGTEFSYKYRKIKSLKVVATKCTRIWKKSYIFYYFEWFWTYSLLVQVNSKNFWSKSFVVSSETYVDLSNLFI